MAIAAIAMGLSGCDDGPRAAPATALWPDANESMRSVRPLPDQPTWRFPGWLRGSNAFDFTPFEPSQVRKIHVEEGQTVSAGTQLASLYVPEAHQGVAIAEAKVAEAKAEFALAEATASRHDTLAQRGLIARQISDESTRSAEAARQRLADARAGLATARSRVRDTQFLAPGQGFVARIYRREGSFVGTGESVLRFESAGEMEGEFRVPDRHARNLRLGQEVRVHSVDQLLSVVGRVREIASPTQQDAGLRMVTVALNDPPAGNWGGRAELEIDAGHDSLWKVAYQAVQHDSGGSAYVMLKTDTPKVIERIDVEVVGMSDQYVIVSGPLNPDQELLVLADGIAGLYTTLTR